MAAGMVDDLATLHTLDENSLLSEIHTRYDNDCIYTYMGDILIAVNPYKKVLLYGQKYGKDYTDVKIRSRLPPHIYAISDCCFHQMGRTQQNQCCVVSGESGSGKTESTKLMVQHIAQLCESDAHSDLHERIVQVNPLLEAFGNAQTLINNNSSRFGKYIELKFATAGDLQGAKITEYLLEKSRVVSQGKGERNFHIFYYVFAGLDKEQLLNNHLERPEYHRIMRPADGSPVFLSDSEFDFNKEMWAKLCHIMDVVGFTEDEVGGILAILAAILHLTDINFEPDPDTEGVYIKDESLLEMAADMLCVFPEDLVAALISNLSVVRGDKILTLKTVAQANDGRDALAKALYGRLFGWIVRQINVMLQPDRRRAEPGPSIGILDIAGFENFANNTYEQLSINTANEQLQYYFNQHIFQWELDEYKREGVKGKDIKFVDNRPLVDLFIQSPLGLFSLLDEESKFPQGSDASFLEKITKQFGKKPHFSRIKGKPNIFVINHYAGPVSYNVDGILEKNRDTMSLNLIECMKNSDSQFVADMFCAPISNTGALEMNANGPKRSRQSVIYCKPPELSLSRGKSLSKRTSRRIKNNANRNVPSTYENVKTLGSHFKNSLTELMAKLMDGTPHFVRCIKPNHIKQSNSFQAQLVLQQLKYTGVLETVKIRRQGYATRLPHALFIERYKFISFPLTAQIPANQNNCSQILKKAQLKDWEIGKTKVFLKYWHPEKLNLELDRLDWDVKQCQRAIRGYVARKRVARLHKRARHDADIARKYFDNISGSGDLIYAKMVKMQFEDSEEFKRKEEARVKEEQKLLREVANPGGVPNRSSRNMAQRMGGIATPIALGNHVYGTGAMVNASAVPSHVRQSTGPENTTLELKRGLRRTPYTTVPENPISEYPTLTSALPSSHPNRRQYDEFSNTSHYARPPSSNKLIQSPIPASQRPSRDLLEELLRESIGKYPDLSGDIWSKLFYMEKNQLVAKVYLREWEVILDNSNQEYDGVVIGLGAFDNPGRDKASAEILKKVSRGVKIIRDEYGNLYAQRLGECMIIVKGYKEIDSWCISDEVRNNQGRLKTTPSKIFDMNQYKKFVADQLRHSNNIDSGRLELMSMVSFCFDRNTFQDLETPCWVTMINFPALDLLGNERVLHELKGMAKLQLSNAEDTQLVRNWVALNKRRERRLSSLEDENQGVQDGYSQNNYGRAPTNSQGSVNSLMPPHVRGMERSSQEPPGQKKWASQNNTRNSRM